MRRPFADAADCAQPFHRIVETAIGVEEVRIDVVWDPVWTKARLSEEGIEIMRSWGISA